MVLVEPMRFEPIHMLECRDIVPVGRARGAPIFLVWFRWVEGVPLDLPSPTEAEGL